MTLAEGVDVLEGIEMLTFNDLTLQVQSLLLAVSGGDDSLLGSDENDNLDGLEGNDLIDGRGGDDRLHGGNGSDFLNGGEGADSLLGGGTATDGEDEFNGGTGFDRLAYVFSPTAVTVNLATGTASDGFGTTDTFFGMESVRGSLFGDSLTGNALNNEFTPLEGADVINGGAKFDSVHYIRDVNYPGGTGGVTVDLAAQTAIKGSGDIDTLISIKQGIGTNVNDTLRGDTLANRLDGRSGNDLLIGNGGNDSLYGGNGTDTLNGGDGDDFIFGGTSTADLRDVAFGGDGRDSIDGGAGNDELNGGNGNDTVLGGAGADTLVGNEDNDLIAGGAGGDLMSGNAGNDTLNGGFGFDRMNGGTGADQFFHQGVRDHGSDWIQDYNAAEGDVLAVGIAGATASQFQVNFATTVGAGSASVQEAFVIYRPTGQVLWALVDGADDTAINLSIGGQVFDLI